MPFRIVTYILSRFLPSFGVGIMVFTSLLLMDRSSRQVELLAPQTRDLGEFITSFLLLAPPLLSYSIALAFLMAMISTLGEMQRDHELQAMFTSGISPMSVLFPYMIASIIAFGVTLLTTVHLTPLSFKAYNDRAIQIARHRILNDLRPGAFFKGIPNSVLLVGDYKADAGKLSGVVLAGQGPGGEADLVLAISGSVEVSPAGESHIRLDLRDGTIHPLSATEPGYKIAAFDQLTSRIESDDPGVAVKKKHILMGSNREELKRLGMQWQAEGRGSDVARVDMEMHRRYSLPVTLLIYPFIIYPLALSTRRHGKAYAFSSSILLFLVSFFLFSLGSRLGTRGRISPQLAAWLPDIVLSAVAVWAFFPFAWKQGGRGNMPGQKTGTS